MTRRTAHVDIDNFGASGLRNARSFRDIGRPLTRSLLAVISETTSPAPRAAANLRNGASVIPDMGASRTRLATSISPIFNGLRHEVAGMVTEFSFFWQALHRDHRDSF